MVHVFLEEGVYVFEGIFVGGGVEVEGAAEEVAGGVGDEELFGGGGVASDFKEDAADPVGGVHGGVVDAAGFDGVFEGHFVGVVAQFFEVGPGVDLFVAYIDAGVECREVYVDPVRVFGYGIEVGAIL